MNEKRLSDIDSAFLRYLRGFCILIIVFGHVGGFWFYRPYSEFLHASVPVFYFISGSVLFFSFERAQSLSGFYFKRIINLLVPYYLLCVLSLCVYVITNHALPAYNLNKMISWLIIGAPNDIMPFPIGQVWFLNVLLIIIIISPFYFWLNKHYKYLLLAVLFVFILLSSGQLFTDIEPIMGGDIINLYKPMIYSSFFIFGILFYSSAHMQAKTALYVLTFCSLILTVLPVYFFKLKIDFAHHNFPPDIYFVSGCFLVLFAVLIFRKKLTLLIQKMKIADRFFSFFHRHTFSIFLLHTFSIYLCEELYEPVSKSEKGIVYGCVKLVAVLVMTCLFSPLFTKLSDQIILLISRFINLLKFLKPLRYSR